jgi:hypothetical protein
MAHHKRGRASNVRAGCKMCKPWKMNGMRTERADGERLERSSPPRGRNPGGGAQGCVTGWPPPRATRTLETGTYPRPNRSHRGAGLVTGRELPVGETRVDLVHLLEDLRDAYPGALEETILTEIVANALDSGASRIRFVTDPVGASFTAVDDGSGMRRRELARYHDVAASTKARGVGRQRKPSAVGWLVRESAPLPEERRGVAVSTFGKVIKQGWEWLGVTPSVPEQIGGLVEVPALAASLTLNKADFIRTGPRGAVYLTYRKAVQEAVSRQLAAWGDARDTAEESRRRATRPLERDLERVLLELADDFPLLATLVERRRDGQRSLPIGRTSRALQEVYAATAAVAADAEPETPAPLGAVKPETQTVPGAPAPEPEPAADRGHRQGRRRAAAGTSRAQHPVRCAAGRPRAGAPRRIYGLGQRVPPRLPSRCGLARGGLPRGAHRRPRAGAARGGAGGRARVRLDVPRLLGGGRHAPTIERAGPARRRRRTAIKPGSRVAAVLTCRRSVALRRHAPRGERRRLTCPGPVTACRPPASWATRDSSGSALTTDRSQGERTHGGGGRNRRRGSRRRDGAQQAPPLEVRLPADQVVRERSADCVAAWIDHVSHRATLHVTAS